MFNPTNIHRDNRWTVISSLRDGLRGRIPNRLGLN
jgi:hypothetical protein